MAGLNLAGLLVAVADNALKTGELERFTLHEPKSAPGQGISGSVHLTAVRPSTRTSGLAVTSVVVVFTVRIYSSMLAEPLDAIDTKVANAVDALFTAYSGDFTLGGTAMDVDLLGIEGTAMAAQAGYITIGQTMFRIMDVTLPIIMSDVYTQAP